MKSIRLFSSLFLGAAIFWGSAHAATEILDLPHKTGVLPNGLRIFLVKYPSPGVISMQLPVHAGSRNEVEKGKTGFAHFFEHLMFRGTRNMSGKAFGELYAKLGAENNAWTWYDMTDYFAVLAKVYLPRLLDAEADRFMNLYFDEKQLKDEAGAVLGEYNKDSAQPEFMMEEKLQATAFQTHPYSHSTMGYKEDILKFTERYKDVWPFFHRYYRPGNVSVILVGDLDLEETYSMVRAKFGGWKNPEEKDLPPVQIPEEPKQMEARTAEVKLGKPTQTRISVAYKVPAFSTKSTESATLSLIAEMSFSTTSEFQKTYLFEKKWLDSVEAAPFQTVDPGLWIVALRFSQAGEPHRAEVLKAVEEVMHRLRDREPAAERLAATKKRFRNAAITSWFAGPEDLAGKIAWYTNFEPDLDVLNRIFERLDEVTPKEVTGFAKRYLVDTGKTTVTLTGSEK